MGIMIKVPGADYSNNNLGTATPSDVLPIEAISIVGEDTVLTAGVYRAKLYPVFTTQRAVVWSIVSGSEYATIAQNGTVTAKSGALQNNVTIRCVSSVDPNVYAEKSITVSDQGALPIIKSTILFDGLSAIDTGIGVTASTEVQVTLAELNTSAWAVVSGTTRTTTIIGGRESSQAKRRDIQLSSRSSGIVNTVIFGIGTGSQDIEVSIPAGNELYVAQGQTFAQYNATTAQISVPSFDTTVHYIIGAQNNNGTFVYTYASHDKFKRVKIYETEGGTLLRDMVPATLNGAPGMYDYVSGGFFTNVGTGTLIVE